MYAYQDLRKGIFVESVHGMISVPHLHVAKMVEKSNVLLMKLAAQNPPEEAPLSEDYSMLIETISR